MPNSISNRAPYSFSTWEIISAIIDAELTENELDVFRTVLSMGTGTCYEVSQKIANTDSPFYWNKVFGTICRKIATQLGWNPPERRNWIDIAITEEIAPYRLHNEIEEEHFRWNLRPTWVTLRGLI